MCGLYLKGKQCTTLVKCTNGMGDYIIYKAYKYAPITEAMKSPNWMNGENSTKCRIDEKDTKVEHSLNIQIM